MSQAQEHLTRRDDGTPGVLTPYYLFLEGTGVRPGPAPGRSWKLRGRDNKEALVQSRLPSGEKIVVRVEATGEQPTEHEISRHFYADGLHLSLQKSLLMGKLMTWKDGLTIPTAWYLNKSESSISEQAFNSDQGHLGINIRFESFSGDKFSLPSWSPLPKRETPDGKLFLDNFDEKDVIRIRQIIHSEKTGLELVRVFLYFRHGTGIVRAEGSVLGRNIRYELAEVSA